jgi:hypothetical protein
MGRPDPVRVICYEGRPTLPLGQLSVHELDLVLSDAPMPPEMKLRAFNHLLGECGVSIFAPKAEARRYRKGFPGSIDGAPFLIPTENTSLRRLLGDWFATEGLRPRVAAESERRRAIESVRTERPGVVRRAERDRGTRRETTRCPTGRAAGTNLRAIVCDFAGASGKASGVAAVVEAANREVFGS